MILWPKTESILWSIHGAPRGPLSHTCWRGSNPVIPFYPISSLPVNTPEKEGYFCNFITPQTYTIWGPIFLDALFTNHWFSFSEQKIKQKRHLIFISFLSLSIESPRRAGEFVIGFPGRRCSCGERCVFLLLDRKLWDFGMLCLLLFHFDLWIFFVRCWFDVFFFVFTRGKIWCGLIW